MLSLGSEQLHSTLIESALLLKNVLPHQHQYHHQYHNHHHQVHILLEGILVGHLSTKKSLHTPVVTSSS